MSANTTFGFDKYPHKRETPLPTAYDWLNGKQVDDNIGGLHLWRIHDDLYDLSCFQHPGGQSFLELSKGTDVTELFESCHPNIEKARALLPKYFVRKATGKRNTASFTFKPNGFYATLRARAWKIISQHGPGPTSEILMVHDSLLCLFLCSMLLMTSHRSLDQYWMLFAGTSGLLLALLANCAHNFFHQRDNWRMYSFDLTTHSSHEWRITHAYSHHLFPNTINDYEVTAFEPFVQYLPKPKSAPTRALTAVCMMVVFALAMLLVVVKRAVLVATLQRRFRWEHALPVALWLALSLVRAAATASAATTHLSLSSALGADVLGEALRCVLWRMVGMYCACSFSFLHISLAAGHHHPDIWHAGDVVPETQSEPVPGSDPSADLGAVDWGLFQLISVGRRPQIDRSVALACMTFGLHQLHHLFPTVDHSKLPLLEGVLRDTCREFGFDIFAADSSSDRKPPPPQKKSEGSVPDREVSSMQDWGDKRSFSIVDGWLGMARQAMRSEPSSDNFPPSIKHQSAQ